MSTDDPSLRETHADIELTATLDDYPTPAYRSPTHVFEQSSLTILQTIIINDCQITSVEKPVIEAVEYKFGQGKLSIEYQGFSTPEGDPCKFLWTYTASLVDDSPLDESLLSFDQENLKFEIDAETGVAETIVVVLKGKLSNEITTAEVQFEVTFSPKDDPYYYINDEFVPAFLKTFKND